MKVLGDIAVNLKEIGMSLDWVRVLGIAGQIGGFVWRESGDYSWVCKFPNCRHISLYLHLSICLSVYIYLSLSLSLYIYLYLHISSVSE